MAKPIFIVEMPSSTNVEQVKSISGMLTKNITDYHILVVVNNSSLGVNFKVFYEKDFDEVRFEELKDIVNSYFK